MDENNLPILHIRRAKKSTELEKGDDLPTLIFQRKRKRFKEKPEQRTKAMDSTIECLDCGTINPLIINSYGKFGEVYCAGCGGLLISYKSQTEEEVFEEDDTELEDSRPIVSRGQPSFSAPSVPKDQVPDRYQPAQGQSRLGRDIQTGRYVDVPQASRRQGLYVIGIPGTGKTGLIENLIIQDIKQGYGVGLLDPHGDLINAVLARMDRREDDVILLDITDYRYPFGLNLFACSDLTNPIEVQKTVDKVMHIFEKLYEVTRTTPLIIQYLRNCTHTLVANPGYTMADVPLLLRNKACRSKLVANVRDRIVLGFWQDYEDMKPSDQRAEREPILRRLEELLQPLTFNIVGQSTTTIDIRQVMDEGKILLVKLDAQLDSITSLIGSILIALFLNAAYSRAGLQVHKRRQFNLYADEFQRFATEDFATILVEARKYGLATTIAHQARFQPGMTDGIRATSLSAKNLVVFKVNSKDGDDLASEFDITPQEAWEEELEPERIKVLRPQQHQRIEEQVEIEVEEDEMMILHRPYSYLIEKPIRNAKVKDIMNALLDRNTFHIPSDGLPALESIEITGSGNLSKMHFRPRYRFGQTNVFQFMMNDVLHDVMEGSISLHTKAFAEMIGNCVYHDTACSVGNNRRIINDIGLLEILTMFYNFNYKYFQRKDWSVTKEEFKKYAERLVRDDEEEHAKYVGRLLRDNEGEEEPEICKRFSALIWRLVSGQGQLDKLKQDLADALYDVDFRLRAEFVYKKYCRMKYLLTDRRVDPSFGSTIERDLEKLLRQAREEMSEAKRVIREQAPLVVDTTITKTNLLLALCEEMAKEENHLFERTGQKRMVKRIQPHITYLTHESEKITIPRKTIMHPQRTYADMHNEVASQLTNLDNFMARVRYINADERLVECTLRTLNPNQSLDSPLFGQALQERKDRIKMQNIQYGYLRERAEVEEEIRQRQEQCSEPPPEAEPPISRHPQR